MSQVLGELPCRVDVRQKVFAQRFAELANLTRMSLHSSATADDTRAAYRSVAVYSLTSHKFHNLWMMFAILTAWSGFSL